MNKKTLVRRIKKLETTGQGDSAERETAGKIVKMLSDIEKYSKEAQKIWAKALKGEKMFSADYLRQMDIALLAAVNVVLTLKSLGAWLLHGKIAGRQIDSDIKDLMRVVRLR
jgi:hypothetical protein